MIRTRIIPILLLKDESLIKTVKFNKYEYIGDPTNTCRIFNELEVDELCFLDILASKEKRNINLEVLKNISNECFMPVSYGGGIDTLAKAELVFKTGFEKIVINTASFTNAGLIENISKTFGNQSIVVSIDVKKNLLGRYEVYGLHGTINYKKSPLVWVKEVESMGAGEILLNNIDREGTWKGFDIELIKSVCAATKLPVIASGGAGSVNDISEGVKKGNASAIGLGSMVVFQGKGKGVLINFPDKTILNTILS